MVPHSCPVFVEHPGENLISQRVRFFVVLAHVSGVGGLPATIDMRLALISEAKPAELLRISLPLFGNLDMHSQEHARPQQFFDTDSGACANFA